MYMPTSVSTCITQVVGALGGQKKALDPLGLESQTLPAITWYTASEQSLHLSILTADTWDQPLRVLSPSLPQHVPSQATGQAILSLSRFWQVFHGNSRKRD